MGLIRKLRDTEPFNHLPEEFFEEFRAAATLKKFPAQTHIFNQHDPPTGYLYVIKEGLVEIVALTPGGDEMVVDYRKEGSFFGGTPVFTNQDYTAGARTVKPTECYLIPDHLLAGAGQRYPEITEYFTRAIFSRVRSLYADMVSENAQNTLAQMEAYPFKKRLSEIMASPVITCQPDTPVSEVARTMTRHKIGAMLVSDEESRRARGIITERDLVAKVLARDEVDPRLAKATDIMTANPYTMTPETYMYEATTFMMGHSIKHMPIVDRGELVGIVSLRDLMKYRSQKSMLLVGSVKEATTIEELVAARAEVVRVAKALMGETRSPFETMEILSYIHHCIQRRGFEIVLRQYQEETGLTLPDIRYCFFIMGSGGRKEMLLGPDQDNGFIFEDVPDERMEEIEAFFVPLAERLVTAFARIGYKLCDGKVMVNNPLWRGRLMDWRARITSWIRVPEPQKVRYSTIFFDFMPLVGDPSLCQDLREIVHELIRQNEIFLWQLMDLDFKHKPPLGLLGRFSVERDKEHKGMISIKQAGSIFIVDCIRIFMLEHHLDAATTTDRLELLVEHGVFSPDTAEHIKAALEAFTYLRLRHEIELIDKGENPTHYLDPYALSRNEQDLLKEAFRAAGKLQDSTKRHFSRLVG